MNDKNALLPLRWTMKQQTSKSELVGESSCGCRCFKLNEERASGERADDAVGKKDGRLRWSSH